MQLPISAFCPYLLPYRLPLLPWPAATLGCAIEHTKRDWSERLVKQPPLSVTRTSHAGWRAGRTVAGRKGCVCLIKTDWNVCLVTTELFHLYQAWFWELFGWAEMNGEEWWNTFSRADAKNTLRWSEWWVICLLDLIVLYVTQWQES